MLPLGLTEKQQEPTGGSMIIKQALQLSMMFFIAGIAIFSYAEDNKGSGVEMMPHHMKHSMNDERISLGLSSEMRQHQLSNMRSHLEAVQAIVSLMAEEKFNKASEIAHLKLGLTEEMRKMCHMFNNKDFTALGLAFHESGDSLGEALKTNDTTKSLRALQATLGYCVKCHATFRQ